MNKKDDKELEEEFGDEVNPKYRNIGE